MGSRSSDEKEQLLREQIPDLDVSTFVYAGQAVQALFRSISPGGRYEMEILKGGTGILPVKDA
jgi:hypothetical protein